ncbi:MAG: hypothetical protein KKH67_12845 [candidate division Zixibacteria bacterium]|nr:hypothetical protein [candidate division Zixibacteria bacterium]MBU1470540.1 hypothetical protein [candidate division Zixibacteria bacterium]
MKKRMLLGAVLILLLFTSAHGTIINVPGDSATIQAGINGAAPGDTVLVAEGHYYERLNFLGKDIFLTSEYMNTGSTISIQNTIIDGAESKGDTMCVIMFCAGETSNAVVQGFTIQNGQGWKNAYNRWLGGGIMCIGASPTITHNIVKQNSAVHNGGGICGTDSSNARIMYNLFTEDSSGAGGAMMFAESAPIISYNEIIGNFADTAGYPSVMTMGGGILLYKCSSVITHNTIKENTASIGGGICCYVLATDLISYNEISLNSAVGDSALGGGISCFHTYSGTIRENIISDNTADGGGGIHVYLSNAVPGEDVGIINNIITGNTAIGSTVHRGGGGVMMEYTYDDAGLFSGNLLAHNTAPNMAGGAVAFWEGFFPVTGNTIAYNSALAGGALYAYATATTTIYVKNTICWGDTGTAAGPEIWSVSNATFGVTYCDVEDGDTLGGNIVCDPAFCDPANGDYHLNDTSCCVGAGEWGVDIGAYGAGCSTSHICGDADASGGVDIDDVVYLIQYIFAGGSAPDPLASGDADCSGAIDIDDVVFLISYIFAGGSPPCDPSDDGTLDC